MCLAVPVRVTSIDDSMAQVELGGITRQVSIMLTPEVKVGDYVLVHTGYAISVVDEQEAEATLELPSSIPLDLKE